MRWCPLPCRPASPEPTCHPMPSLRPSAPLPGWSVLRQRDLDGAMHLLQEGGSVPAEEGDDVQHPFLRLPLRMQVVQKAVELADPHPFLTLDVLCDLPLAVGD